MEKIWKKKVQIDKGNKNPDRKRKKVRREKETEIQIEEGHENPNRI